MDVARDTPVEAEAFGFVPVRLTGDPSVALTWEEFAAHIRDEDGRALILMDDPYATIARHCDAGQALDAAIDLWCDLAQVCLCHCRTAPRRIALVQRVSDKGGAAEVAQRLAKRFPDVMLPDLVDHEGGGPEGFVSVVRLVTARDALFRDLYAELQARSLNPVPDTLAFDESLGLLLREWSARGGAQAGMRPVAERATEAPSSAPARRAPESQVTEAPATEGYGAEEGDMRATLTAEVEALRARIQDAAQIETILCQQLADLKQALLDMDARSRAAEAENQLLKRGEGAEDAIMVQLVQEAQQALQRLHKEWACRDTASEAVQDFVRQTETALGMVERRSRGLHLDIARLQSELHAVYTSTSWRVTGPMRSVKRVFQR